MNLVLVLGDQLTSRTAALKAADRTKDLVVLAEVTAEAAYVRHHPKKIALIFAAMRKFADRLRKDGWQVAYARIDDPDNAGSIPGELLRHAKETGASRVIATEPGEWRLGYSVTAKSGDSACPFNILYWHFLIRHRDRFESNPRMAPMYRTRDGKDARSRQQVLQSAEVFLDRMSCGDTV